MRKPNGHVVELGVLAGPPTPFFGCNLQEQGLRRYLQPTETAMRILFSLKSRIDLTVGLARVEIDVGIGDRRVLFLIEVY